MEEAPENSKESSHSVHTNGMKECYVQTSKIVLDLVTKIIVDFYIDFTSRLFKQIWLFPFPHGFCNPVQIHGMKINDTIWYDMIWYDMIWYDMIRSMLLIKILIEYKICNLIFPTNLSEKFLILRKIQWSVIINVHRSSCKVLVLFIICYSHVNFLKDFQKIFHFHILWNTANGSWVVPCGQTDIWVDGETDCWTDRQDKASSNFMQICDCA